MSSAEMAREGPVEDLPLRALSRPRDTARVAQRVLAANRSPYVRSYAGQALGIATREIGDVAQAVRYLLFGEGETGLMVYTILLRYWEWTPEDDVRPLIFLMSD